MNKAIATKVFESLASGIRLDVWRLLVKSGLEGMVAGQLASELDIARIPSRFTSRPCCTRACSRWSRRGVSCAIAPISP